MIISEYYQNQSKIGEITKQWKTNDHVSEHSEINECLTVDALFFSPDVQISPTKEVSGIVLTEEECLFRYNPDIFKLFLQYNLKKQSCQVLCFKFSLIRMHI